MKLKSIICFVILSIIAIVAISFMLAEEYRYANIEKEELKYVSEIYMSSDKIKGHYRIICESGNKYFITYILADDEHIESLNNGDVLELGIYKNDIIELVSNGNMVISIDDCNERYTKQFNTSIIVIPLVTFGLILLIIGGCLLLKRLEYKDAPNYSTKENEIIDERVYDNIQKSIYKKGGLLRCNILEQIESDKLVYTFYKAMLDYVKEQELVLLIDDGGSNDELAMVFYKSGEKLFFTQLYRNGNEPFEIEKDLFWYYPHNTKPTKIEQEEFDQAVKEYIIYNPKLLK